MMMEYVKSFVILISTFSKLSFYSRIFVVKYVVDRLFSYRIFIVNLVLSAYVMVIRVPKIPFICPKTPVSLCLDVGRIGAPIP